MTFGLLEAVAEEKITESQLVRKTSSGRLVLTCEILPGILERWELRVAALRGSDAVTSRQWFSRVQNTLKLARHLLLLSIQLDSSNPLRYSGTCDNDIGRIVHACAAIADALNCWKGIFYLTPTSAVNFSFANGVYNCYENDMIERGWCPFIVRFLQRDICMLGYASSMEPSLRRGLAEGGHDSCSRDGCHVNNIDTSSCVVQHSTRSCSCTWKGPPLREVIDALAQDNPTIPVITVAGPKESLVDDLSVTCRTGKDTPYAAISHVWADGLGSNTETGLPSCQLRRIASLATSLVPGRAFWMDSLCVPRQKDMRRKAIGLMAQTYRDAEIVSAIDAGIRSCSVNSSTEEKLLRVLTSGWMQRLWTLQ